MSLLLLVAAVAGQPVARAANRRGSAPGQSPDDPRVQRDARRVGGGLELALEVLRQPEREAGGEPLLARDGGGLDRLAPDVDELRVGAGEANLDVAFGQLRADLQRRLAQGLEQAHPGRAAERLDQALRRGGRLLVADGGDGGEVPLERCGESCRLHGVIMTPGWHLSSTIVKSAP